MAKPKVPKHLRIRDELIYDTIMELVQVDAERAIRPEDVAMSINPEDWQPLLKRIRLFGRKLALDGYIDILRKGAAVDPDDFRGVYRLRAGARAAEYLPRMPEE